MSVETAADRAHFLADFGVSVVYDAAGGPETITGILDAAFVAAGEIGSTSIATHEATLTVRAEDLPDGAAPGDTAMVDGTAYRVREIQPDGTGMAFVLLEIV